MATKSILKSVKVRDSKMARGLASALENAEKKGAKDVFITRRVHEVKGEGIKSLLERSKCQDTN